MKKPSIEDLKTGIRAIRDASADVRDGDPKGPERLHQAIHSWLGTIDATIDSDKTADAYRAAVAETCVTWRANFAHTNYSEGNGELESVARALAKKLNDQCHTLMVYLQP